MEIMAPQPELNLEDPKTQDLLNTLTSDKVPDAQPAKEGEKPAVHSQKAEPESESKGEAKGDDPEAQIRGLRAELARRQGNADRVHELELQLAKLQGETSKKTTTDPIVEAIQELGDKDLIGKQTDWEAELAVASAKFERAEENQNTEAMRIAGERMAHAKRVLSLLRTETLERGDRKRVEYDKQKQEVSQLETELDQMRSTVIDAFPEFENKDSELWKAGNAEYIAHPGLMSRMGAAGEIVAVAMAILKNPSLTKGTSATTRRDVLKEIDKGFGKALKGGSVSPSTGRAQDYAQSVQNIDGLGKFNDIIENIKAGGRGA